jgi:CBS domain-containing protein
VKIAEVLRLKGDAVVTITPDTPVSGLVAQLARHRVGALVVSADGRSLDGIVSERDVVRRLDADGNGLLDRTVGDIMTSSVRTCTPQDTVDELMALMTEQRVRHVPVLQDGKLVGIVSIGDVVKQRIDMLKTERDHLEAYITT